MIQLNVEAGRIELRSIAVAASRVKVRALVTKLRFPLDIASQLGSRKRAGTVADAVVLITLSRSQVTLSPAEF